MKMIHAIAITAALTLGAGSALAQSAAPMQGQNKGGQSDVNATTKAPGVDQAKKGAMAPSTSTSTTGAAVKDADMKSGMTKDKGGLATPSKTENNAENKSGAK